MTWTTRELRANRVPERCVRWRELRRKRGLTLRAVAERIGRHPNTLHRIEIGRMTGLHGMTLCRLALFFRVKL